MLKVEQGSKGGNGAWKLGDYLFVRGRVSVGAVVPISPYTDGREWTYIVSNDQNTNSNQDKNIPHAYNPLQPSLDFPANVAFPPHELFALTTTAPHLHYIRQ